MARRVSAVTVSARSRVTRAARCRPRPVRPARVRARSASRTRRLSGLSSQAASSAAYDRTLSLVGPSSSRSRGRSGMLLARRAGLRSGSARTTWAFVPPKPKAETPAVAVPE